ncbi:MAG: bifunctional DNA-formamidopyrimidine glycosylase/DNA-(apurinic or apyrimidinic site) lyase, partial [Candidatus Cloacimonetes bacterium]|nr:bifunctional DNA-formamidopyrimidine glycosylase/DNA-(apurinic or apyrimidinic site) lyase [Candidatus Cloacimonadota bacterium]
SQKQARIMVKHTKDVLAEALSVGGTSISDYRRIDDKTGEFQHFLQVYQKQQCPLGHDLANIRLGGRSSFYCPICQK